MTARATATLPAPHPRPDPRPGPRRGAAPRAGRALPLALALAALSAPVAAPLAARAEVYDLGEIVVSPTLEPTEANKVGATVDVVDSADLRNAPDSTVAGALSMEPGLSILSDGGPGQQTSLSLRGVSQNYVEVLIDGIDVGDPSGTQVSYDFGHLGTAGIDRIEILKGSQSALYGSSAVGGVISIDSRHATEPGLHQYFDAEYGSHQSVRLSYGVTLKTADSDLAATLSHVGTTGYPSYVGPYAGGHDDGYRANRLSLNGSHTFANGLKLGFAGFYQSDRADYFPAGSVQFAADPAALSPLAYGKLDTQTYGLRVYGTFRTGVVEHTLSVTGFRVARHYIEGPAEIATDNSYVGTRQKFAYKGTAPLGAKARLTFGADSTHEGLDEAGTYGALSADRHIEGIFAELSYSPTARLDMTAALRHDHDSRFGGATTGRLALAWRPNDTLTLRASAGTGFRAPSNYELFSLYGNSHLDPEKSRSFDLGAEKRFGPDSVVRATLFWLNADNLIGFDYTSTACASGFGCYAQVPGSSRRSGIEIEGETKIGAARLKGSYTYVDSSDSAATWAEVPRHSLALELSGPIRGRLSGRVSVQALADRATLPNTAVANLGLSYRFTDRAEGYLRLENLFDTKYQLVEDYGTSGRALYVGIRTHF